MAGSPLHVAVLGAGSWGTALAALASAKADTLLWARSHKQAAQIRATHRNQRYLPDIPLPPALACTSDFQQAINHVRGSQEGLIILGVPVAGLHDICTQLAETLTATDQKALHVVWTCKGFHAQDGRLPHEIIAQALNQFPQLGTGVLSGPSFALEVARGLPVALTMASQNPVTINLVTRALHGISARIYSSSDIVGVEAAGALKNIMAIACGISDAQGLGANARAALITRGLAEMRRLGVALGGQADTFSGLAGVGDLVLTATGDLSRNRRVGLAIGQGQSPNTVLAQNITAEGVRCAPAVLAMGKKYQLDLPITRAVNDVLFNGLTPDQAARQLLSREAGPE